jgi:hypothetical protein
MEDLQKMEGYDICEGLIKTLQQFGYLNRIKGSRQTIRMIMHTSHGSLG